MKPALTVYVDEYCPGCVKARQTASFIEQEYPDVQVRVIDVSEDSELVPNEVFATPTYMLDNRIVSLGNPGPDDIARWMAQLTSF
jgi:thiol-disulfide isomerase/thioredoxin